MRYRNIPNTSLKIPIIGQGTMGVGGYFTTDSSKDNGWISLIRYGIDLGATFIDTAENYGAGHSEELVGAAIKGIRQQVYIASKFLPENNSYDKVIEAVEGSLNRLNTDYLDIYQLHWPNYKVPLEETAKALYKLVKDGKVRFIGACNCSISELVQLQEYLGDIPLSFVQHEYNLLERHAELQILPYCVEYNKLFIAYSPLLIGAWSRKPKIIQLCKDYNISIEQLSLLWVLQQDPAIVIPFTSSREHMQSNIEAADLDYSEILTQIDFGNSIIQEIPTSIIRVVGEQGRIVYTNKQDALENKLGLEPSSMTLSQHLATGCFFKPIKVKKEGDHYMLLDGRTKFWAWIIAYGEDVSIPAYIIEET